MNQKEAKEFFMRYNGLEYHMFHDETQKYNEYRRLHLSKSVLEEWRQELINECFLKLNQLENQKKYWILIGNLIDMLFKSTSPIDSHILSFFQVLSRACDLDENQKIRILEHMVGHGRDGKDGGIYLILTRTHFGKELKMILEKLSQFNCSLDNRSRYLSAIRRMEQEFALFE